MKLEEELAAARAESDAARKRVQSLEERYERLTLAPLMRRRIGECFRYRNTFGGDAGWWLYVRIVGVGGNSYLTITAQKDIHGRIQIEKGWISTWINGKGEIDKSYQKITAREFLKQAGKIFAEAKQLLGAGR